MQAGGAGDVFVADGGEGVDEAGGEAAALCGRESGGGLFARNGVGGAGFAGGLVVVVRGSDGEEGAENGTEQAAGGGDARQERCAIVEGGDALAVGDVVAGAAQDGMQR